MCGIAGIVWNDETWAIEQETLDRMTDVLRHRGPDGRGTHLERGADGSGVGIGHRRLSIIDVAGGQQPLCNEDGTVWITFNGEIYNYRELRTDLVARGHRFRTHGDTETIVHLYEEHGVDCLKYLCGMFAFAIWDANRRRLFLARDRLGKKPVVYRQDRGRLLFASEIKAILQAPGVPREMDPVALDEYLTYNYVPHPRTMFVGIRKLPPAHYAVYENRQLTVAPYWSPDFDAECPLSLAELREELGRVLDDAVRLRLRSDVPLGAFLSGGIDSTAIVGLMQRHLDRPAKTCTIGFPVARYDETQFARVASEHLGTEHHQMQVYPDSVDLLPTLVWHFDEPFADSSAIPTYYLAQMTRQHVTVALTGDGGDELFAGYPRYQTIQRLGAFERLPGRLRRLLTHPWWDRLPGGDAQHSWQAKLRFRLQILREPSNRRYVNWIAGFLDTQRHGLYTPGMAEKLRDSDPTDFVADAMNRSRSRSPGIRAMRTDLLTYLPCDLLAKVDVTSMAHGLECRSPFLDHRVVELATTIPFRKIVSGRGAKPLLTSTFPEMFPSVLRSRSKMGFSIPLDDWFRGELRETVQETLLDDSSAHRGYFNVPAIRELVEQHCSGKWNHGDRLWSLLFLEIWHRTYIDSADPPVSPLAFTPTGVRRATRSSLAEVS